MNNTKNITVITTGIYILIVFVPSLIIIPIDVAVEFITGIKFINDSVIGSFGILTLFIIWLCFPAIFLLAVVIVCVYKSLKPSTVVVWCVAIQFSCGYGKYAYMYSN